MGENKHRRPAELRCSTSCMRHHLDRVDFRSLADVPEAHHALRIGRQRISEEVIKRQILSWRMYGKRAAEECERDVMHHRLSSPLIGKNAHTLTGCKCPVKTRVHEPFNTFHMRTAPSSDTDMAILPVETILTSRIIPVCPRIQLI